MVKFQSSFETLSFTIELISPVFVSGRRRKRSRPLRDFAGRRAGRLRTILVLRRREIFNVLARSSSVSWSRPNTHWGIEGLSVTMSRRSVFEHRFETNGLLGGHRPQVSVGRTPNARRSTRATNFGFAASRATKRGPFFVVTESAFCFGIDSSASDPDVSVGQSDVRNPFL